MIRPRRSIREKLVTIVMSTTLAALAVSVGTVVVYDLRSYKHALLNDLATQAELVGHMTSAALAFDDARLARENLALLRSRPSVRAAAIYDEHGALFATYVAPGATATFPVRPEQRLDQRPILAWTRRQARAIRRDDLRKVTDPSYMDWYCYL